MPTYLLHGFRWPRNLIRIHIILQNLDDAAAEWLMAPATKTCMLENFKTLHPKLLAALPSLQFIEQFDAELAESTPGGNVQPFAYVADVVEEVKLGVEIGDVMGRGVGNDAWAALTELRDQIAPGEKVAWFVVVCQDTDRWAPEMDDSEEEEDYLEEEEYADLDDAEADEELEGDAVTVVNGGEKRRTVDGFAPPVPAKPTPPIPKELPINGHPRPPPPIPNGNGTHPLPVLPYENPLPSLPIGHHTTPTKTTVTTNGHPPLNDHPATSPLPSGRPRTRGKSISTSNDSVVGSSNTNGTSTTNHITNGHFTSTKNRTRNGSSASANSTGSPRDSLERPSTAKTFKNFFSGGFLKKSKSLRDLRRLESEKAREMAMPPPLPGTAV